MRLLVLLPLFYICGSVELPQANEGKEWHFITEETLLEDSRGPRPTPPVNDAHERSDSLVVVSIAAYRDGRRCGRTLFSLFTQAEHPARVRVGVVQQNAPGDPDCVEAFCALMQQQPPSQQRLGLSSSPKCQWSEQVSMRRIHHHQARGPVRARALGHALQPADADPQRSFCLQIDSHMLYVGGWLLFRPCPFTPSNPTPAPLFPLLVCCP